MQVGSPVVAGLEPLADRPLQRQIGHGIEQRRARKVHGKTGGGNCHRFVVVKHGRLEKPHYQFASDAHRHHREHERTGGAREVGELAGAEGKARIPRVAPGGK